MQTPRFTRFKTRLLQPRLRIFIALFALLFILSLLLILIRNPSRHPSSANHLGNPPGIVDRLLLLDTPDGWRQGTFSSVEIQQQPAPALQLPNTVAHQYPRVGSWTSPIIAADFPFTELLPSWNAHTPPETGIRVEIRVRDRRKQSWSPWLYMGSWGRVAADPAKVLSFNRGIVNADYLVLDRPADAIQTRVFLESFDPDPRITPTVRRLSLCYSGIVSNSTERARLGEPTNIVGLWARDLPVPFRTQADAPPALRGEICSPTSVSMVMAFWGVDRPTLENAVAIYDADHQMFGNWNRAVQRPADLGLDAWLMRFRDWEQVKAQISQGNPVIASIRFKPGEFPSAVLKSSTGHLIVIRGFTPAGDVIVNDPADRKGNAAIYKADELARAWFGHGGVGYVMKRGT